MIAVAALALVTGNLQANVKPAASQPKTGTLIIYRKWTTTAMLGKFPVYVDHKFIGFLKNGCYYKLELSPGSHSVSHETMFATFGPFSGKDSQPVNIALGQTIYFCRFL